MAFTPSIPLIAGDQQIPVIAMKRARAERAYAAYSAMRRAEKVEPALAENPIWVTARNVCWDAFNEAYARLA